MDIRRDWEMRTNGENNKRQQRERIKNIGIRIRTVDQGTLRKERMELENNTRKQFILPYERIGKKIIIPDERIKKPLTLPGERMKKQLTLPDVKRRQIFPVTRIRDQLKTSDERMRKHQIIPDERMRRPLMLLDEGMIRMGCSGCLYQLQFIPNFGWFWNKM